jgi:beta-1,4-mannosyltransferase
VFRRSSTRARNDPIRVVVSSRPPAHGVGYVDQLVGDDSAGAAPAEVALEFREDALGASSPDVAHLTSLAAVIGDHRVPAGEQVWKAKRFVKALKRRRIALVRTVFENQPRPSAAELIIDDATTAYICLSPSVEPPRGRTATVIPHSHLRARFLGYPTVQPGPRRLLFLSAGVLPAAYEGPLKVFALADLPGWTLRIVGRASATRASSFARTAALHRSRITLLDSSISDAARVEEITATALVVAAAPDSYETLRTIMLALSLDRPVLVEATPSTTRLAQEVGGGWVRTHEGRLTAEALEAAVRDLEAHPPVGRPDLEDREPNAVAAQYAAVFRAVAGSR